MEKVIVKLDSLSRVLFNLKSAGCVVAEISVVEHAVKVEGQRPDGDTFVLHAWSRDAEDTEDALGKGDQLLPEEIKLLDQGKCPKCPDGPGLVKGGKMGLALRVTCEAGHMFLMPPPPFIPEYLGQQAEAKAAVKEEKKPEAKAEEPPSAEAAKEPGAAAATAEKPEATEEEAAAAEQALTNAAAKAEEEAKAKAEEKAKAEKPAEEPSAGEAPPGEGEAGTGGKEKPEGEAPGAEA